MGLPPSSQRQACAARAQYTQHFGPLVQDLLQKCKAEGVDGSSIQCLNSCP